MYIAGGGIKPKRARPCFAPPPQRAGIQHPRNRVRRGRRAQSKDAIRRGSTGPAKPEPSTSICDRRGRRDSVGHSPSHAQPSVSETKFGKRVTNVAASGECWVHVHPFGTTQTRLDRLRKNLWLFGHLPSLFDAQRTWTRHRLRATGSSRCGWATKCAGSRDSRSGPRMGRAWGARIYTVGRLESLNLACAATIMHGITNQRRQRSVPARETRAYTQ
jgi:hypothetical protein